MDSSYHYDAMRRAIDLIDSADGPLTLEGLAERMDMSPAHFQRLFSAWVGISPKRYQQYLQLGQAKRMLSERMTTLAVADEIGLSGSSRLHDLFVRWEAMSPGDFARGGEGLVIEWDWFDSPFGAALVMATERGICGLAFGSEMGRDVAFDDLAKRWPKAQFVQSGERIAPLFEAAMAGRGETRLHMIGAPFQIKVWEALLNIPEGHVTTYSEIATRVGSPKAVRAVGTAVGRNPVSYLIPCHRALRKSGELGGYHWGLPVKRAMLAYESARTDANIAEK